MPTLARNALARSRATMASVRVRLTVVATVLMAVGLAVAAAIMLLILHRSLLDTADGATRARVDEVAAAVRSLPPSAVDPTLLARTTGIDLVQVIDAGGTVVASSPGARVALTGPMAGGRSETLDDARAPRGVDPDRGDPDRGGADRNDDDGAKYRATARAVSTPTGTLTIVVGAAEGPIDDVVLTVALLLAAVFPVVLALLAGATYVLSGRTLAPVERIRSQVADLGGRDLGRRIPVPATRDEIARLADTMNAMLERLDTAQRRQVQFVGDASHELRSPLVTLLGLMELAAAQHESIDPETVSGVLLPETRRLHTMIDDLLLLARSDEQGLSVRHHDVDLDDVVDTDLRRLRATTDLEISGEVVAARVAGDRDALARALRNITDNAVRHARLAVRVSMTRAPSGTVLVHVDDDGPGIPPQDRGRVVERFVRLDDARARGDRHGSGLGLAIVSEIVAAHGGVLTLDESPLHGTRATIALATGGSSAGDQSTGIQSTGTQSTGTRR
ncbi:ATP-binding protein [Williamsia sp. MIQD14]|uniref:sensor histidine kinase n=1 Tax=Williamsia sp. MIQD14 TaxID=3425703 RepID=UPI003DA02F22